MSVVSKIEVRPACELLKALSDETRLRVAALLSRGELCVCHIEAALELSQPRASRSLGILRHAGVVEARRQGSWVYYRLAEQADPDRARLLRSVLSPFAKNGELERELRRLIRTKGPLACRS
jgi:ArsR family transcriptional regulator, arsenate/arsenite/antimonite-responsive transcriptional repressor